MAEVEHFGLENCELMVFEGVGKYDIPYIVGSQDYTNVPYIRYDYVNTIPESQRNNFAVDFCVEDKNFLNAWRFPERWIPKLRNFRYVIAPDFSIYANTPIMYNLWNHYRKHWLSAYWQYNGINVIPLIRWSLPSTFEWCFDGEPTNSVVFVSSIGVGKDKETRKIFLDGFFVMMERLNPVQVLCISNMRPLEEIADVVTPVYRARPYPK